MQSIRKMHFIAAALAASGPAFAHEAGGWASIHWHVSDLLGLALVGALSAGALWLARPRQHRPGKK